MQRVEAGLLDTCRMFPDDIVAHLVLADWLEEDGQIERSHAIRFSIYATSPEYSENEQHTFQLHSDAIIERFRDEWELPLRTLIGDDNRLSYRYGLPNELECPLYEFVDNGSKILAVYPTIQSLNFSNSQLNLSEISALANSPTLASCTQLDLNDNGLDNSSIQVLTKSSYISNLKSLWIGGNRISDTGIRSLADCSQLQNLKILYLGTTHCSPVGVTLLASSPYLSDDMSISIGAFCGPFREFKQQAAAISRMLATSHHLGR